MHKKRILIDLDGVLNEYGKDPFDENFIPKIKDGAKEFIQELYSYGELYLFTTRNSKLATMWLIDNGLEKYFKDVTNIKLPSYIYIDDRNLRFNGDYNKTLDDVKNFQVYWK